MNILKKILLTIMAIPFSLIFMAIGLALYIVILAIGGIGLFIYYIGAFIWYFSDAVISTIWSD